MPEGPRLGGGGEGAKVPDVANRTVDLFLTCFSAHRRVKSYGRYEDPGITYRLFAHSLAAFFRLKKSGGKGKKPFVSFLTLSGGLEVYTDLTKGREASQTLTKFRGRGAGYSLITSSSYLRK